MKSNMKNPISHTLFAAICLAASTLMATAQGRTVFICASSIPDDIDNPTLIQTSRGITELTLSRRSSSQPVQVPADGQVAVVREIPDPANPEEMIYQALARATVPEGVNQALIMLMALPEAQPNGIRFHATVHDLSEFRGGGYMFLNLTRVNVEVRMGDERLRIAPGRNTISNARNTGEVSTVPISYHFHDPRSDEWRLISASTVARIPTRREIAIFSWDERYNRISYHGITFPVARM